MKLLSQDMTIREKSALLVFGLAAMANLVGNFVAIPGLVLISKPLIMLSLLAYFISNIDASAPYRMFIVAIICCLAGDIFLLFNKTGSDIYFLAGLSSFLLGHIAYYLSFKNILNRYSENNVGDKFILPGIMVFFTIIFLSQLIPYVDAELRLPVTVYAMVITLMMIGASKLNTRLRSVTSKRLLYGALIFTLSDCILSMSLFRFESEAPGFRIGVMSTYILAQYLLVTQFKQLLKDKD